jgi:hypothetical protein
MTDVLMEQAAENWAKRLALASCVLWLASLALPAFMVDSRAESMLGGVVLLTGLLFGWSAYANIFFAVAAMTLLSGGRPRRSVLAMLAFGATLPIFKGVIRDEGSGTILPVVSWGWGAVIWILALLLLATAAAIRARLVSLAVARTLVGLMLVSFAAIVSLHFYQRAAANFQERSLYLSSGLAFTRA